MQKTAHKVEWLGNGQYRCVNCGNEFDKEDMVPDYASIADDVARMFEETEAVAKNLAEVKELIIGLNRRYKS